MLPATTRIKMSEYVIPFHIQEEIMKRLPVKSLIQFRSVSKAWKSLIDSPEFIVAHSLLSHTQHQHLLVSSEDQRGDTNFVCYIDDDTFPQQRYIPTLSLSVKHLNLPRVIGSSCGLVCVFILDAQLSVLWNPSIRKSIDVALPKRPRVCQRVVGFGVCPVTYDPKIVSVTWKVSWNNPETKLMVYTLSSGKWRSLPTNLPTERSEVVTDQFIYWRAGTRTHNMIISCDLTNESFEVIDLPDSLARLKREDLNISKLRESLAILEYKVNISTVWMMEDGVQRSFTKLFTIKTPHDSIVGFARNGLPIMPLTDCDLDEDDVGLTKLVAYEPNSQDSAILEIPELLSAFYVNSYTETLLLLDRADCNSY